jgi:DNA ligase 4
LFNSANSFIKLKKDYILGLKDTADFAIVRGHCNTKDKQEISIRKLWWTSFYIRCLENKDEVCCFNAKLRLCIINVINQHSILKENILYLNCHGYFEQVLFANSIPEFDVGLDYKRRLQPAELFKHPFSVELMGASFDKPADTSYFALRFPRLLKIHRDRSFNDTISFEEL